MIIMKRSRRDAPSSTQLGGHFESEC